MKRNKSVYPYKVFQFIQCKAPKTKIKIIKWQPNRGHNTTAHPLGADWSVSGHGFHTQRNMYLSSMYMSSTDKYVIQKLIWYL